MRFEKPLLFCLKETQQPVRSLQAVYQLEGDRIVLRPVDAGEGMAAEKRCHDLQTNPLSWLQ